MNLIKRVNQPAILEEFNANSFFNSLLKDYKEEVPAN